jgi:hypothetical protein
MADLKSSIHAKKSKYARSIKHLELNYLKVRRGMSLAIANKLLLLLFGRRPTFMFSYL